MKLCKVLIGFSFVFFCLAVPAARPAAAPKTLELQGSSKRLGYCHCGCSSVRSCRTSADCGGASCDNFISCC